MEILLSFVIGVVILMLVAKLLKFSSGVLIKLLMNALVGGIIIFVINVLGSGIGLNIELNFISALIVGIFGVLGVIFLIIF